LSKAHVHVTTGTSQWIIDTDTANEVDDLFAIVRAVKEPAFDIRAINSVHWQTRHYATPDTLEDSQRMNGGPDVPAWKADHAAAKGCSQAPAVRRGRTSPSSLNRFFAENCGTTEPKDPLPYQPVAQRKAGLGGERQVRSLSPRFDQIELNVSLGAPAGKRSDWAHCRSR
jgi:hypothetical protein